ncbi:glyoxylase-like metal-dependent hydrolase (beta-lactamase superfamily II) [Pullulanibacillus pueri]|uniref:Hydrolase n=1 Tax=Pullulanibacillus pueri TaxID=1437324 RepID=A0A8J2ZUW1_9BACL|nr:MBL fold metallo-hydrolase [Pullulanibacillus pueri]MBM7681629.1 glyoxylase-like metal-dependent hydrolase (beta-lactamase superfamily II) [Pullulanibacillus pueri]GGH79390.1 hydrolase [Pullulanibacillus pueri]
MQLNQIEQDIWQIELETPYAVGPVNIYIIIKNNRVMMVDAGVSTYPAWRDFQTALHQLNLTTASIDCLVLTHHHPDHTGFLRYLPTSIDLYGHWRNTPWISHDTHFMRRFQTFFQEQAVKMGVPERYYDKLPTFKGYLSMGGTSELKRTINEGDEIPGFEEWQILYTPGHAQSHISLYRATDGVFMSGDFLLEHISTNALLEPPYNDKEEAPKTFLRYRESLIRCLTLDIRKVLPGHGKPFLYPRSFIEERLHNQDKRFDTLKRYIKEKPQTVFEIGKRMFRFVFFKQMDLVLFEVQGYLEWLAKNNEVTIEMKEGTYYYKSP